MSSFDLLQRRAGLLLHPTSLPSGILDGDVERWLQFLSDAGFRVWQVLPLGEPQSGLSPYQCSSAFAFNPLLLPEFPDIEESDRGFVEFCHEQKFWLDDYVLFKVLKQHFDEKAWTNWPEQWKYREPEALQQSHQQYKKTIADLKWQQYQLEKRWHEIKNKAAELDILLFGDMPIFVAHDSADVWAHPEWFLLDANGEMEVVTGVPPDYFSETGQRWGNPHYDWDNMREDGFLWWKSRINHHLELFDLVRIDHFRGLDAAWTINASCETAVDGHWQHTPGDELLCALKTSLNAGENPLPLIAEDLGVITPEVTALRKKYKLPGMSILQFGFDQFDDNPHKLKNIEQDKIVYTGTHDNDTTKGWFNSLENHVKNQVLQSLELLPEGITDWFDITTDSDSRTGSSVADMVVDTMINNAMNSRAVMCIIPMQDYLHLDTEARMNIPGTTTGNWLWQMQWTENENNITGKRTEKMRSFIETSKRSAADN